MPVRNERFRRVSGDYGSIARPYLRVRYINPHTDKNLQAWALIDTGADDCVLPASFAGLLGHNLIAGVVDGVKARLFAAAGKWWFETASALPEVHPSDTATS